MAFDEAKDKELFKEKLDGGLVVSVKKYEGGEPKIQVGPREVEVGGVMKFWKAGRLSVAEYNEIVKLQKKIKEAIAAGG